MAKSSALKRPPLDVAIVGGGLVGSLCACYMARRGHNVKLYEYRDDIRKTELAVGRSINMSMSTRARIALRELNLEDDLIKDSAIPMKGRMIHGLDGSVKPLLYDPKNKQTTFSVGRKKLNEILLTAAEQYPGLEIFFNHKLLKFDVEKGKASFLRTSDHKIIEVVSDLIVGADGAYSAVRKSLIKQPMFNYSQTYIEHGYLELSIPPTEHGQYAMEVNYLHIWPRGEFMMIALPNLDRTYTVTLFMPFAEFQKLTTSNELLDFFLANFPDAIPLMGEKRLIQEFFKTKPQTLVSVKCQPYHFGTKTVLVGDAAHAMVPFYGQGMNSGFEDCYILDQLMTKYEDNIRLVLPEFTAVRCTDGHAICDLAMYNYIEMRDLVNKKSFLLRKKIDHILYTLFPDTWIPLYSTVTFSQMGYQKCRENKFWQDEMLKNAMFFLAILGFALAVIMVSGLSYKKYI